MKNLKNLFILAITLVLSPLYSEAQYSWQNQNLDGNLIFNDVFMVNTEEGYAVGTNGTNSVVYKTTNGGNSWVSITPPAVFELISAYFSDFDNGYVVTIDSDVYGTIDGGSSWILMYDATGSSANNMTKAGGRIFVTRDSELLYSDNGGSSWQTMAVPLSGSVLGISFSDASNGWICGAWGGLARTVDGGNNWSLVTPPSVYLTTDFYSIHAFDATTFIAVGFGGAILKTFNTNSNWIFPVAPSSQDLSDVHFYNGSHGVAVGGNGTIHHSTDGGGTWINTSISSSANIYSTMVMNNLIAFSVGGNGEIWGSPDEYDLSSLTYLGPDTVCADVPFDFTFSFYNEGPGACQDAEFNCLVNSFSNVNFPTNFIGITDIGEYDTLTVSLVLSSGSNSIELSAIDPFTGNNFLLPFDIVAIDPGPTDITGDMFFCPGDTVTLTASGGLSYAWDMLGGVGNATNPTQSFNPVQDAFYTVEIDQGLCKISDTAYVYLDPNCADPTDSTGTDNTTNFAFSPNGDNVNDFLVLDFLDGLTVPNNVRIFNRWGNVVYETDDYDNVEYAWDGSYGERTAPVGTYFFVVEADDIGSVTGWIHLVR